jgi:guanine nucleotide-binding protein alpha-1 subunit
VDVCKARLKTVGVTETPLKVKAALGHTDWLVIDIGGSRTHRAAWKPFFDDGEEPALQPAISVNHPLVHAIVFLAPLSAYNQKLEEMQEVNRLEDSLLLWQGDQVTAACSTLRLTFYFRY